MSLQAAEIFNEAREMPVAERASFLRGACGKDVALRVKVEALLKADAEAGGFMATPTAGGLAHDARAPSQERAGALIGRYKLLEQIGEGGMGTIWMAEQREPVKRRVALKIIKLGMDTRQVIARFEAERQALAMMDHPNIAKVLDAGATETGRPYFVMEYIKGIPILEYCDQEKVDTRSRLELFTKVCHAIQHAHQKGIIHRDIKPSNVLVTLHDGVPAPKVIDFGIAKATNSELTTKTLFTAHRQMIGTPAYMSPEQAEMSGLDIDTRSDVYSLGVLLYELLTGTTPFDTRALLESGYAEMMRAIREDEPHKPSTRISSLGDTGARTAQQRRVDARKLSSLLRGDVDWIVMKCIEKDRSRRYETANGLAADIQRHLNDEPVTAGAPSPGYRLLKFVRRNRAPVLAVGAVVAALLLGVVAFAWQAEVARDQRDRAEAARTSESEQRRLADAARAEAERQQAIAEAQEAEAKAQGDEAQRQAAIAEAVAKFQTDMLAAVDPDQLPRDPTTGEPLQDRVTVVQAMEAAVRKLDQGALAEQPLVEARVRETIGTTLLHLARYDDAEPNLRKSVSLLRAAHPAESLDLARALNSLATLLQADCRPAEAEALLREALEIHRAAPPAERRNVAAGLNNLAVFLQTQNRPAEAEALLRDALEISRSALPAGHPIIAQNLDNLAKVLQDENELEEAETLLREALAIRRAALPAGHPNVAKGACNLAVILQARNKLDEAEPLFREALEISRAALPAGHPEIALYLNNLAKVLHAQSRSAEAEPLFREALETLRASLPAEHRDVAMCLNDYAMLLRSQHRLEEAESLAREALAISRASLPARHPNTAVALSNLASILQDQGLLAEAEPLAREALEIWRAARPAGHPDVASGLHSLASLLKAEGRLAEAEPLAREALEIWRAALPDGHPSLAAGLNNLAVVLWAEGRFSEAEPLFREALGIFRATRPEGLQAIATCLRNIGVVLRDQGELAEAEPLFREALDLVRAGLPAGHPDRLGAERNLADLYSRRGKHEQAALLMREVLEADRAALPADSPELAGQLAQLGLTLLRLEAWAEAEPLIREALAIREGQQPDDWRTFNTRSMLGAALLGQNELVGVEALLLDGYRGMKEREADMPPQAAARIREALERLVRLYEAQGNASEAAAWRGELEAASATPPDPGSGDRG